VPLAICPDAAAESWAVQARYLRGASVPASLNRRRERTPTWLCHHAKLTPALCRVASTVNLCSRGLCVHGQWLSSPSRGTGAGATIGN